MQNAKSSTPRQRVIIQGGFWNQQALHACARSFLAAGMIVAGGAAFGQTTLPDSQVEANVLKALAGAPELAGQSISTNTVGGVVTLSGSVQDDASRVKAENLAASTIGVKKVVDQLQVSTAEASLQQNSPAPGMVLQSDGTYAPASSADGPAQSGGTAGTVPAGQAQRNDPEHDQALDAQREQQQGASAQTPDGQIPPAQQPNGEQQAPPYSGSQIPPGQYPQSGSAQNSSAQYPQNRYPAYPQGGQYPQGQYQPNPYPPQGYAQQGYAQNGAVPYGGQVGGQNATIPAGTLVRVRVNRLLASDKAKPGDRFDGTVANDVVAGGFVAIPRGAQVQGTVVDAHPSGAISGRGEMTIQLNSLTLGGQVYALTSDNWTRSGPDKTGQTVSNAAGLGIAGAVIGAIAGRGAGAAIGAGVGTAAGIGASAASPKGQVVIPPEGMISFNLAAPLPIKTVSEQEIQRLAYGAGPGTPNGYPPAYGPRRPIYQPYPGYYPPPPPYYPPAY